MAAFVPELPMLLQAPVGGVPLDLLLSRPRRSPHQNHDDRAQPGIRGAATALAALHGGGMISGRTRPVADELARMQQRSQRIMGAAPAAGVRAARPGMRPAGVAGLLARLGRGNHPGARRLQAQPVLRPADGAGRGGAATASKLRCWTSITAGWRIRRPTSVTSWPRCGRSRWPGRPVSNSLEEVFLAAYLAACRSTRGFSPARRRGMRPWRSYARGCAALRVARGSAAARTPWCRRRGAVWRRCSRRGDEKRPWLGAEGSRSGNEAAPCQGRGERPSPDNGYGSRSPRRTLE